MSSTSIYQELNQIYQYCLTNCRENERWPSYYQRRYLEFLSYMESLPSLKFAKVLELGCGIGYQSAFLSKIADQVIATDLADEDIEAHAPGMKKAEELHKKLNISNVKFVSCSAEDLPFEDASFDLVYSSHVLEHIPDLNKAMQEMARVLKPGGIFMSVTPTTFEKFYGFLNFYFLIISRVVLFAVRKLKSLFTSNHAKKNASLKKESTGNQSRSAWSYFPFPPPHGTGKSFLSELSAWTPSKWKRMVSKSEFDFIKQQTTQWMPALPLLGFLFPLFGTRLHALTRKMELKWGKYKFFQAFGINTMIMLRKKGEPATNGRIENGIKDSDD